MLDVQFLLDGHVGPWWLVFRTIMAGILIHYNSRLVILAHHLDIAGQTTLPHILTVSMEQDSWRERSVLSHLKPTGTDAYKTPPCSLKQLHKRCVDDIKTTKITYDIACGHSRLPLGSCAFKPLRETSVLWAGKFHTDDVYGVQNYANKCLPCDQCLP